VARPGVAAAVIGQRSAIPVAAAATTNCRALRLITETTSGGRSADTASWLEPAGEVDDDVDPAGGVEDVDLAPIVPRGG